MKKWLTVCLTLSLLLTLTLPALAAEAPADLEVLEETLADYDRGYHESYAAAYTSGYAAGQKDAQAGAHTYTGEFVLADGATYADGRADGQVQGYEEGYMNGYYETCGRDYFQDVEISEKGGVPGQVNVMYEGKMLSFPDVTPVIKGGSVMVPVRTLLEAMGAHVDYGDGAVKLLKDDTTVTFAVGSAVLTVEKNGTTEEITLPAAAYVETANGEARTMVPLRAFAEALGYTVFWDGDMSVAVVVDLPAEIAAIDSQFTYLNQVLDAQITRQAGQKLTQTGELTGTITLYDEDGKPMTCSVSASAKAYTDGKAVRMDVSVNVKDALMTLLKFHPELLRQFYVDLKTALSTDLTNLPITLLMTEDGAYYLQMPLLNSVVLGVQDDAWLALGTVPALPRTELRTIGQILTATVPTTMGAIDYNQTLNEAAQAMAALLGDQAAKKNGTGYTWTYEDLTNLPGTGDTAVTFPSNFTGGLSITLDPNGNYGMEGQIEDSSVGFTGSLTAAGTASQGQMTLQAERKGYFTLKLTEKVTTQRGAGLLSLQLPDGAVVMNEA